MAADSAAVENTPLLSSQSRVEVTPPAAAHENKPQQLRWAHFTRSPASVLPIAILSALAMAATAATQIYAYASLLCQDPQHCREDERRKFAGSVAIASTIANGCALFAIRGFEGLSRSHGRAGLAIWLVVRAMSVGALSLGVFIRSIGVAMSSQVFEGLASDNILHFNLNAIYVRTTSQRTVSKLIGASLALYMVGISISPTVASLLGNFEHSFLLAYGLFLAAFVYLFVVVRIPSRLSDPQQSQLDPEASVNEGEYGTRSRIRDLVAAVGSPFLFFLGDYWRLMPGLALFLYNSVQAYTFSAIMVHTSIHFGFSSRENGFLLTIVHMVASLYLFFVLFAVPRISALWRCRHAPSKADSGEEHGNRARDAYLALTSLLLQAGSLVLLGFSQETWQIYATSALLALGLSCPSFIKSYLVANFVTVDKPRALAALAVMETGGGLVAPIMLGGMQAIWPGRGTFFVAAAGIGLASVLMACAVTIDRQREATAATNNSLRE